MWLLASCRLATPVLGSTFCMFLHGSVLLFQQSCGGGVLRIKAVHFENYHSQLSTGSCCDGTDSITGSCDLCEYYFRFCFSFFRKNNCTLLNVTTHVLTSSEFYLFPTSFRSRQSNRVLNNPMIAEFDNWVVRTI